MFVLTNLNATQGVKFPYSSPDRERGAII